MQDDTDPIEPEPVTQYERLHVRLRRLILMRETGPKRFAWHRARTNLIWRTHREMEAAKEQEDKAPEA
jgi:hypothetical protein